VLDPRVCHEKPCLLFLAPRPPPNPSHSRRSRSAATAPAHPPIVVLDLQARPPRLRAERRRHVLR
jgi:hypothetical protein